MEHPFIILSGQANAIEAQIEADNLFAALHLFKEWEAARASNSRKMIILLMSRLNEINHADRSGRLSFSQISRLKTKLKADLLDVLYDLSLNEMRFQN